MANIRMRSSVSALKCWVAEVGEVGGKRFFQPKVFGIDLVLENNKNPRHPLIPLIRD
jgi:hypothetical protein